MKYIAALILLFSSSVFADINVQLNDMTLSWPDNTGYMQVQNASTYETICEGNIAKCAVTAGTYHIIDLDTGDRADFFSVAGTVPPTQTTQVVRESCVFDLSIDQSFCNVQCSDGQVAIPMTCRATIANAGGIVIATSFESNNETFSCIIGGGQNIHVTAAAMCQ